MMYYLNDLNSITIAHRLPDILGSEARAGPVLMSNVKLYQIVYEYEVMHGAAP